MNQYKKLSRKKSKPSQKEKMIIFLIQAKANKERNNPTIQRKNCLNWKKSKLEIVMKKNSANHLITEAGRDKKFCNLSSPKLNLTIWRTMNSIIRFMMFCAMVVTTRTNLISFISRVGLRMNWVTHWRRKVQNWRTKRSKSVEAWANLMLVHQVKCQVKGKRVF